MLPAWWLLAACSHPPPAVALAPAAPAPVATVPAVPLSEPPPFRAFSPPLPIRSPGPPTDRPSTCLPPDPVARYELSRERAALDAALRANGGFLLPVETLWDCAACSSGAELRGPGGERLLYVERAGEGADLPLVGMDADREVFVVHPVPKPARTRSIRLCTPMCRGSGVPTLPMWLVVEVPEGARLGAPREVAVPLDVQVVFAPALDALGRPLPPCTPP